MSVKNVGVCGLGSGNTGVKACYNDIGIPKAILFAQIGKKYTTASIAALKTVLEADILADNWFNRLMPVQNIVEITDNSTAPTTQTFAGDNSELFTSPGYYKLGFQWVIGGICLLIALLKSNNRNKGFFIVDSYGQLVGQDGGGDNIMPFVGNSYTNPFKWSVGPAAVAAYITNLIFEPTQANQNLCIVNFNNQSGGGLSYLTGLNGLLDVDIVQTAARASGVNHLGATIECGSINMHDSFAAALAVTGAWKAKNTVTGKPIVVTAVADDPTNLGWTVTLDTTDANYSTSAGGNSISLAGPTELAALGTPVVGYESNYLAQ